MEPIGKITGKSRKKPFFKHLKIIIDLFKEEKQISTKDLREERRICDYKTLKEILDFLEEHKFLIKVSKHPTKRYETGYVYNEDYMNEPDIENCTKAYKSFIEEDLKGIEEEVKKQEPNMGLVRFFKKNIEMLKKSHTREELFHTRVFQKEIREKAEKFPQWKAWFDENHKAGFINMHHYQYLPDRFRNDYGELEFKLEVKFKREIPTKMDIYDPQLKEKEVFNSIFHHRTEFDEKLLQNGIMDIKKIIYPKLRMLKEWLNIVID